MNIDGYCWVLMNKLMDLDEQNDGYFHGYTNGDVIIKVMVAIFLKKQTKPRPASLESK